MKDRTQELRSVSLGVGKTGGGTPISGERVGVEWGRCWVVGANYETGGGWQGHHNFWWHLMFPVNLHFGDSGWEVLGAGEGSRALDTPPSQGGPGLTWDGESECQEGAGGAVRPAADFGIGRMGCCRAGLSPAGPDRGVLWGRTQVGTEVPTPGRE